MYVLLAAVALVLRMYAEFQSARPQRIPQEVCRLAAKKLEVRLVTHCQFIDETDQLLVAGVGGAHLIDMVIKYKYSPRQAILLDPKGTALKVEIKMKDEANGQTA